MDITSFFAKTRAALAPPPLPTVEMARKKRRKAWFVVIF